MDAFDVVSPYVALPSFSFLLAVVVTTLEAARPAVGKKAHLSSFDHSCPRFSNHHGPFAILPSLLMLRLLVLLLLGKVESEYS